jgi:enoyl-CoA hydratase/carnithine racemase
MYKLKGADFQPQHFQWSVEDRVATITINRPERKNPLTFDSYAELRDTFHKLQYADDVKAVVITGAGGNFCSGGDVHEIIGPLVEMDVDGHTRARSARPHSSSCGWDWQGATWARARSCRASSATAVPRSCSTPAG